MWWHAGDIVAAVCLDSTNFFHCLQNVVLCHWIWSVILILFVEISEVPLDVWFFTLFQSNSSRVCYHWPRFFALALKITCFFRFGHVISSERIENIWAINIFKHHVLMDEWMSKRAFQCTIYIRFFFWHFLNDDACVVHLSHIVKLLFSSCCSFFSFSRVFCWNRTTICLVNYLIPLDANKKSLLTWSTSTNGKRPNRIIKKTPALTIGDLKLKEGPNEKFQ